MSKRGENIRKRKDGRWEARIKINTNGTTKYHSVYGHSYKETKEKKEFYLKNYSPSPPLSEFPTNKLTLEQLLDSWILDKELYLKKSTLLKYRTIITTHIIPELGSIEIKNIDNDKINRFLSEKMNCGSKNGDKGLSNS